jgi:Purine catabolism regulatory protein-like family/PucR C-terminal helix-turn-helix domain
MEGAESGHSVLTVGDLLGLEEFMQAEVSVAAAGHRLGNRVEWVHVFETPFVAGVIRGGEFLLTTGIGLAGMRAAEVEALVAQLARAGAAGIGFEPTHAPAATLVEPCRRHELPLLVFGQDVRFVEVTHVVHERLVSSELATLRRAVGLQAQLREAAREGLGPAGLVAALGDVLEAQVLLERADRTPIASSPEGGLDVAFMDALDRRRQRLPTPLHSRPVNPAARLHMLPRRGDELDLLAVDEAAFLLSVAMAAQPPREEVPSAERARLLQRLAEGRAGAGADIVRRARSVGVDFSRATLWAFHGRGSLGRLERMGLDALVDGPRALVAVRGDLNPAALARDLARRDVTAVGYDSRGNEPWQVRDALAGAERACLVAEAAGPAVRRGSELGALGGIARDVLAGERIEPRLDESGLALVEALVATGWSKAAAARRLRISRQALYERIAALRARYDLDPDLPQTRVELALEVWAVRMGELA